MEKIKELHNALEKLQRDASKKIYPKSELKKKEENPDHVLKNPYYKTTADERKFMKEFVEAIEKTTWISDEGLYANLVDAIAVEIPGILRESLPVIHNPEARKFVEQAKAHIVPFIREHKNVIENVESVKNQDINVDAAVKAAENIPVGQTLYEKVLSASHGENRRLEMQNRSLLNGKERLGTKINKLDTKIDKLDKDKKDLKKDNKQLKDEVDLSVDYALEQQDEVSRLQSDLNQAIEYYESENEQLASEKENLVREKSEAEQRVQELDNEASSLRDLPERLSQYEAENERLLAEKENIERELEEAKNQTEFNTKIEELKQQIAEYETRIERFTNATAENADVSRGKDETISQLQSRVDEYESRIAEYEARIDRFNKSAVDRRNQIESFRTELDEAKLNAEQLENALEAASINQTGAVSQEEAETINSELKDFYDSRIAQLESEITNLQERIMFTEQDYESDVERLQSEIVELQERVTFAEQDLDIEATKANRYEFEMEHLKSMLELEEHAQDAVSNEYEERIRAANAENQALRARLESALNELGQTLTVDDASVDSVEDDYQALTRPQEIPENSEEIEASGAGISALASREQLTPLDTPSEISAGSIDSSVDNAEVSALRAELASVKAENASLTERFRNLMSEYEQDAERRYDLFYIAENDPKLSVESRIELYKEYLRVAPEDMHIAGIVYSNFAEILGNKKQDYVAAEFLLNKAITCAEKDLELTNTNEARERLAEYKADLQICKDAKIFFEVGVETIPFRKVA